MKRCSFCEWIPILPWPVWPLAEQCSLGQNVVVGSMLVLQVALGNVPRGVCLDPRLHYKCTSPRLPAELPCVQKELFRWIFLNSGNRKVILCRASSQVKKRAGFVTISTGSTQGRCMARGRKT